MSEGLEPTNTTNSGTCGHAIFDDETLVTIEIKMLRVTNFAILDYVRHFEKTVAALV